MQYLFGSVHEKAVRCWCFLRVVGLVSSLVKHTKSRACFIEIFATYSVKNSKTFVYWMLALHCLLSLETRLCSAWRVLLFHLSGTSKAVPHFSHHHKMSLELNLPLYQLHLQVSQHHVQSHMELHRVPHSKNRGS